MYSPPKNPSIREIAEQLKVSKSTVALALNTPENECPLATQTRDRIRKAAAKMGYRTNAIARTMRTGKFNAVTFLVGNTHPLYLPAELVHGLEERLEERHYRLQISWLSKEKLKQPRYIPNVLRERSSDGLLIHYPGELPEQIRSAIDQHAIPSVVVNDRLEHDCVHPDDYGAAKAATRHLLDLGHRNIGYLHLYQHHHYSEKDRRKGYEDAMSEAGLSPHFPATPKDLPSLTPMAHDHRFEIAKSILQSPDRSTALLCYEIAEAAPLITAALALGIRIPGEVSLMAFGRMNRNDTGVDLSTLQLGLERVGREAADMLLRKLENPTQKQPPVSVPLRLQSEATLAAPTT